MDDVIPVLFLPFTSEYEALGQLGSRLPHRIIHAKRLQNLLFYVLFSSHACNLLNNLAKNTEAEGAVLPFLADRVVNPAAQRGCDPVRLAVLRFVLLKIFANPFPVRLMVRNQVARTVREQAGGMGQQAVNIDFAERLHIKRLQEHAHRQIQPQYAILHQLGNRHGGN